MLCLRGKKCTSIGSLYLPQACLKIYTVLLKEFPSSTCVIPTTTLCLPQTHSQMNGQCLYVYKIPQSSTYSPQYQCRVLFYHWQPQRNTPLIMAGCLNANTENDIPCQQCASDTSLSLQIPPLCSRALFSTLVSRQRERFPLLVSIKRVNSLHLSTYHLRAPAWRADDLSVLPDTVWETVISLIRDRARAIISDMILTSWNPSTLIHESVRPVTSSPPSLHLSLSLSGKSVQHICKEWENRHFIGAHTYSHKVKDLVQECWTCDAKISYSWISRNLSTFFIFHLKMKRKMSKIKPFSTIS